MKLPALIACSTVFFCDPTVAQNSNPDSVGVVRSGSGTTIAGSSAFFTGKVEVRPITSPEPPARASLAAVTFQPNARSNWHTHPAGQILYVTEGCGWTQREGGAVVRICKGDTAYVPPGTKHWHGATNASSMTHLAITETLGGKNVEWMEPVNDDQYAAGTSAR